MKTIAEIATDIGVSRQAVHKKIKQEPLSISLQKFISTKGNTVYIEFEGEKLIKSAFSKLKPSTKIVDEMTTQFIESLQEQIKSLTEQNKDFREQLNQERQHNREQADKITELAAELAKLANNAQHLHAGDIIPRLKDGEKEVLNVDRNEQQQNIKIFSRIRNFLKKY